MPDYSDYGARAYISPLMSLGLKELISAGRDRNKIAAAMDSVELAMALEDRGFDEEVEACKSALRDQTESVQRMVQDTVGLIKSQKSQHRRADDVKRRIEELNTAAEELEGYYATSNASLAEIEKRLDEELAKSAEK